MEEKKSLKVNSILNVIKTLSSLLFPLITFPYISRVLLPENVGKINFGTAFVSYFSLIASLGITTYAVRECSAVRDDKKRLGQTASEIFSINVCTTIVAYILLGLSLVLFRKLDNYRTLIIIQSTAILFTTLGTDWLNTAMEDFKYITLRTVIFQFVSLPFIFVYVRNPDDYLKYAAISVLSSSGVNLVNIFYRKKFCVIRFTKHARWNTHFKPILLMFVMILAQTVFNSADVTMLGLIKGDFEAGIYGTANKIMNLLAQVVSSLVWVYMPRISFYFAEGDFSKINSMLRKTYGLLVLIGLPSIVGGIALSREIVLIIGGEKYIDASSTLCILLIALLFSLLGGNFLGNMILLPSKKESVYMVICCITAVVNVILNLVLIPVGGADAAAFTTAVSAFIILIMLLMCKDKRISLNYVFEMSIAPFIGSIFIYIYCKFVCSFVSIVFFKVGISIIGSIILYVMILHVMKNEVYMEIENNLVRFVNQHR